MQDHLKTDTKIQAQLRIFEKNGLFDLINARPPQRLKGSELAELLTVTILNIGEGKSKAFFPQNKTCLT